MKAYIVIAGLILLLSVASAETISTSVRGNGDWDVAMNLGTAGSRMGGMGDMSYAAMATLTDDGALMKNGLDFDGRRGRFQVDGILGPDLDYSLEAFNATNISMRTNIDTLSKEETENSKIGKLLLYSTAIDGQINGSISESVFGKKIMGRPMELSRLHAIGSFEMNTNVGLDEYER